MRKRRWVKSNLGWLKAAAAVFLLCAATATALRAQTFHVLHRFDGSDGYEPNALIQATSGSFYGTASLDEDSYNGTVFKITPSGTLTTLYHFSGTDGREPIAALVQAMDGSFYGTTVYGGASDDGTVFKISPDGILTTLHSSNSLDGYQPDAPLIPGPDGNLYGTTLLGGPQDNGTIFKITPAGTLTTLHTGARAVWLLLATDGNFYGAADNGAYGDGTIFKMTPRGELTTLYNIDGSDGAYPVQIIQGADGSFYGTTSGGGDNYEGTVFRITPTGTLTTLHSFDFYTDGGLPYGGLVQATDGDFYGTTYYGGPNGAGTVFKITSSGAFTTLYNFDVMGGAYPIRTPALFQGTDGLLYGITDSGGDLHDCHNGCGTIFALAAGLGPFVETQPTSGRVGLPVKILGTNLTGATSVTFNGVPATFTVFSHSLIGTTVPAGATTGKVQVVTPGDTLTSNVDFRVNP